VSYEVVVTRLGARAMRDRATGEVMHPVVGPLVEARELYLAPSRLAKRLAEPAAAPLVLFDVGLGAGSLAAAAWQLSEARTGGRPLSIVSFDRTVAALELALASDHAGALGLTGSAAAAARAILDRGEAAGDRTRWHLIPGELPASLAGAGPADIVYWDPYSPKANPGLWTVAAFRALRAEVRHGTTVHTYSAATSTRSALILAGFAVGIGAPIGAKQQTTAAAVDRADLERPLDQRWVDRLARSSAPLPADAPADAVERIRRQLSG
jgi:queuine tRNA-ribosyltransferase